MFAQVFPRVNTNVVPVTPHSLNRITSNRFQRFKFHTFCGERHGLCRIVVQQKIFTGTSRARTHTPKLIERKDCLVVIIP
jgi:hypothetical protein